MQSGQDFEPGNAFAVLYSIQKKTGRWYDLINYYDTEARQFKFIAFLFASHIVRSTRSQIKWNVIIRASILLYSFEMTINNYADASITRSWSRLTPSWTGRSLSWMTWRTLGSSTTPTTPASPWTSRGSRSLRHLRQRSWRRWTLRVFFRSKSSLDLAFVY